MASPIPPEVLDRVLDEQNPWHRTGAVPAALAPPVERPLARWLWTALRADGPRRFHLVLGPRRAGKTTVLYQTVRHLLAAGVDPSRIWWLRLDHPELISTPLGDLVRAVLERSGATGSDPVHLMVDELVYADDWDLWLKTFHDDAWPVRLAATSSATAALRQRRPESGVGRWSEHHLSPCLLDDHLDLQGIPVDDHIEVADTLAGTLAGLRTGRRPPPGWAEARRSLLLVGGFPELLTTRSPREDEADQLLRSQEVLRADAVERAVYKDIPQSAAVDNPLMLERLLYTLAGQITGVLSPTTLSRTLRLSQPTVDRYLTHLERAFLVFTVPNFSGSEAAIQRRGRKVYFVDGAVRNAALQRGLAVLDDPAELGLLIENLVAATLRSLALHTGVRLHHWRHRDREVDLIYDHPEEPLAFEVASSPGHSRAGLRAFADANPRFGGRCYIVAPQVAVLHPADAPDGIGTLPLDLLLVAAGAQARDALRRSLGA